MPGVPAYDFVAPRQILFGWGRRSDLGKLAQPLGKRAFLIIGSRTLQRSGVIDNLVHTLLKSGIAAIDFAHIDREPLVDDVDRVVRDLANHAATTGDFIIGIGGGAALDLAKAVAALAVYTQPPSVVEFLEGVGTGRQLTRPTLPILAVPTTAGTGAEATRNAVISSLQPPFKKSLRADGMMPSAVLVDPELTTSLPAQTTAYTGMDAITQLLESYLSCRAKPLPRALCLQGLDGAAQALVEAMRSPASRPARETLAHAALLSGLALANSGLGFAHGVAAALGVHCQIPHGLACAVMLPAALRVNRDVKGGDLDRLAPIVTGKSSARADALIDFIDDLCRRLEIPQRLSNLGIRREQIPALVAGSRGNSMSGNPRDVSDSELSEILEAML